MKEVENWKTYHEYMGDYQQFVDRIGVQNNAAPTPTINQAAFKGSLGAVDGTYSVVCRMEESTSQFTDDDGELIDQMHTNYKKCFAYKLVLVTSHMSKYILALEIAPGSSSDSTVYNTLLYPFLTANMIREAALLGDHAFQSVFYCICPYATVTDSSAHRFMAVARERFNHNQSKDRMASEHGNCHLKKWAIVRGRTDHIMFENENEFVEACTVCWGLHNWILFMKEKENRSNNL